MEKQLSNIYNTLRDIKTYIKKESCIEHNIIQKNEIIVLLKKEDLYSEYHDILFYKFSILYNNKVHIINGRRDSEKNKTLIEDVWQDKFFIHDFENEEYYYWENTFKKVGST